MNRRALFFVNRSFHALLVSLAAATTTVALATNHVPSPSAEMLVLPSNAYVACGMTSDAVVNQLGAPGAKLGSDIWVYWNFRAKGQAPDNRANTLLVVFTAQRVSRLRYSEREPVVQLLKRLEANRARAASVATK